MVVGNHLKDPCTIVHHTPLSQNIICSLSMEGRKERDGGKSVKEKEKEDMQVRI